jgi:hypothetical protein
VPPDFLTYSTIAALLHGMPQALPSLLISCADGGKPANERDALSLSVIFVLVSITVEVCFTIIS